MSFDVSGQNGERDRSGNRSPGVVGASVTAKPPNVRGRGTVPRGAMCHAQKAELRADVRFPETLPHVEH
jgi:hypothetical protein